MKLNILFMLNKAKVNSVGKCPIKCRITFNLKRKEFSTGIFIATKHWNNKQQIIKPPEPNVNYLNSQLSLIRTKLSQAFLFLQVKGSTFTVEEIYKQYKGETNKKDFGVMEVYNLHSDRIKKLISIEIQMVTYTKYLESGVHLQSFIKHRFKQKDIQLKTLKSSFLEHYDIISKQRKKCSRAP